MGVKGVKNEKLGVKGVKDNSYKTEDLESKNYGPELVAFYDRICLKKQEDDITSSSNPLIHTKTTKLSNL